MLLFCEYAVAEGRREACRAWILEHARLWAGAEILENEDQPGVFVEIWPAADEETAERIRKERLDRRSEWKELEEWVKGGRAGIRLWTFRPVTRDA